MRRIIATFAGLALVAGMSVAPAQANESPITSYSMSSTSARDFTAHTLKPEVAEQSLLLADEAAKPAADLAPKTLPTSQILLYLGLGLLVVGLVSGLSIRSAVKATEELEGL